MQLKAISFGSLFLFTDKKQVKPIGFAPPGGGAYNNGKHLKQECPSIEGIPPACFDLVDCCDLDRDHLIFLSELDLDMVVTYLHAKN